ncbi:mitochondrial amidoxime reducing component 2-like protein, partial [Leptotrombidium deliense]
MKGMDCGDEYAIWIQKYLQGDDFRMMRYVQDLSLSDSRKWTGTKLGFNKDEKMVFHDANAVHVINNCSVADINNKIPEEEITYRRFRPNILIECEAYIEDRFQELHINDTLLRKQLKTGRCVLTTVNPDKGTMSSVKEPLLTLRKCRMPTSKVEAARYKSSPVFGINFSVEKQGIINVNDNIIAFY